MQSTRIASAGPLRHVWWGLLLMFGFTIGFLLMGPSIPLLAASNGAPMADAARTDDLPAVRKLIKERGDVNAPANDGSSALLWAAFHSNTEIAKALLAAGASVDAPNRYGVTPLLQASRNGNVEMMRVLLEAGAQPTRWHPEGETPLMAASRTGNVEAVKLLLSRGSFVNATDPFQEQTALMWASADGHVDAVKTLLAAGADPNLKAHVSQITNRKNADYPSGGFTALMFAARNGHVEVVRALMKGGADPKLTNADSLTAPMIAIINDRFDLAKEMFDLGADPNDGSLYYAVDMHDQTYDTRAQDATRMQPDNPNQLTALNLIKSLLDLGADVNKPVVGAIHSTSMCCGPSVKNSPFYRAATASDVEVLKLLVAQGAKLDWTPAEIKSTDTNTKGPPAGAQSALMAAMKGGTGPAIQGGPGYTRTGPPPYREPGSREPLEAMNVLLTAGANPNVKGPDGSTPLHQAVQAQQVAMIRALAGAGASLTTGNKDKLTPLALAEKLPAGPVPPGPGAANGTGAPAAKSGPKRDSREDVIATLRELMHLGPDDPGPPADPVQEEKKVTDDGKQKSPAARPVKGGQ